MRLNVAFFLTVDISQSNQECMRNEPAINGIVELSANDRLTNMTELQKCLERANAKGFVNWFKATDKGLKCIGSNRVYKPNEVTVPNFFRFEGISDPDDMSILYEIETFDGCKGTLIDAYGVYADSRVAEFMTEVQEIHKKAPHEDRQLQS